TLSRMIRDMRKDWLGLCNQDQVEGLRDPLQYIHLCVIPTYTEPYHVLEQTVQAIVDSNYPADKKMVGIITRETDKAGWVHHAREPLRDFLIWQPVPLFHNNIWQVPMAVRVMSAATSQWQMFLHSRPHRLVAFSSYTCSLEFVHRVGYWDKDVIPEDSRFYWKAFFTFGKRFSVKSVYLPLYGDSPKSRDYASTHQSQYDQIKRWAWGITDVPYVLARFFQHPEIPLWLRFRRFMNLF